MVLGSICQNANVKILRRYKNAWWLLAVLILYACSAVLLTGRYGETMTNIGAILFICANFLHFMLLGSLDSGKHNDSGT